jgi:hypothetical protein
MQYGEKMIINIEGREVDILNDDFETHLQIAIKNMMIDHLMLNGTGENVPIGVLKLSEIKKRVYRQSFLDNLSNHCKTSNYISHLCERSFHNFRRRYKSSGEKQNVQNLDV